MKQINDIPVRRRPHSKDAQAGEGTQRSRRQIWQIDEEDGVETASAAAAPSDPVRPRSTPLILTSPDAAPGSAPDATDVPRRADVAPTPDDAPVRDSAAVAPSRILHGPSAEHAAPQKRSAVSRPRVAEPPMAGSDDAHAPRTASSPGDQPATDDLRAQAQASSLRQRSRPIMPQSEPAKAPPPPPQASKVSRAKTRILGFHAPDVVADPLAGNAQVNAAPGGLAGQFPVGWLVIVEGPGRGASFSVATGVSTIGRGDDQSISLDFGDQSVSRSAHASVVFDEETHKFFIGHGGKSNVVRRNGVPVLATEEMSHGDLIRIGKTTLRFAAFCGADFTWGDGGSAGSEDLHG